MKNKILSIQSKVVYGYLGSNVAELAIQLHGLDIIAFPTVYLAAHTGHQPVYGTKIDKKLFDDLITGVKNLDIIKSTIHILSGYIASEEVIDSSAKFIKEIKDQYPDKLYICDPVMGDTGGLYVSEGVTKAIIEQLLPLCDVTTPNHFEFEYITGKKVHNIEGIKQAIAEHPILKEKIVVITSCQLEDTPENEIEIVIVKSGNVKRTTAKKVDVAAIGTGDFFTALVTAKLAIGHDIIAAVDEAAQMVTYALAHAVESGDRELNARGILLSTIQKRFEA